MGTPKPGNPINVVSCQGPYIPIVFFLGFTLQSCLHLMGPFLQNMYDGVCLVSLLDRKYSGGAI